MFTPKMKYGTLCYLSNNDEVLMINKNIRENDPNSGQYTLPGGKLENYERKFLDLIIGGAWREFYEETGLKLFNNSEREFDNWENPEDFMVYVFSSVNYLGKSKERCGEGTLEWVNKKNIYKLPQNSGDPKIFEWLEEQREFRGVIKHKGKVLDDSGTFVDYFI